MLQGVRGGNPLILYLQVKLSLSNSGFWEHRHKQMSTDREERRERKLKETDKESKPRADSQGGLKDHDNNLNNFYM